MRFYGRLLKGLGIALLAALALAGLIIAYLSVTEYRPEAVEPVAVTQSARRDNVRVGGRLRLVTLNTGYAGLGRERDFFMDGGAGVKPDSEAEVRENLSSLLSALSLLDADICFLQEVDRNSSRSYDTDQPSFYQHGLSMNTAFALNYKCDFVPYPWPPIGRVEGGLLTLTNLNVTNAARESLPCPFSWPIRLANLKRCLLIERVPVEGSDKEMVLVNLHLEAYDNGEGKARQTKQLMSILAAEYRNGNYVVAGGDFNQSFEGTNAVRLNDEKLWQPSAINTADLADGFRFCFDASAPTCRSLDKPYDGDRANTQFYWIDGFIVSNNLKVNRIETIDLNFVNSDHNPVLLEVTPV